VNVNLYGGVDAQWLFTRPEYLKFTSSIIKDDGPAQMNQDYTLDQSEDIIIVAYPNDGA